MATIITLMDSWGGIPDIHGVYGDVEEANAAWRKLIEEKLEQREGLCDGEAPCGGGDCQRWGKHTVEELAEGNFVTDWDDVELRWFEVGTPDPKLRTLVFDAPEFGEERGQVLVTIYPDGRVDVAARPHPGAGTWGVPWRLTVDES